MRALTVAGLLLDDTTFRLDPGFVVDADVSDQRGDVEVVALDHHRRVLARTRLALQSPCSLPSGDVATFAGPVHQACLGLAEFPEATYGLCIVRHGKELYRRTAPGSPTEFDVKWPQDMADGPGGLTIHWTASSEGCLAALGYSNDGGMTWLPVSAPTSSNTLNVDWSLLPGGKACLFELMVTDGWITQRFRTPAIDVAPRGWRLWIASPSVGQEIEAGEPVSLTGYNFHTERRVSDPAAIRWTSSVDGSLGSGGSAVCVLTAGTHQLVACMEKVVQEITVVVRSRSR